MQRIAVLGVAAVDASAGRWAEAAERYAAIGTVPDEMYARLRAGDEENVRRALDFYRSVGAIAYVAEAEAVA